ncbi:carbohydrate esterase family 16 protein [Panus rudis PR-1116 ss-1]|nr:carbohydrate esterase family 16 protein [Panus rudis PR-1116 ss-1]
MRPMRLTSALTTLLAYATLALAVGPTGKIKNLVTFGDSYTDVFQTGDGGTAWPVYAAGYGNYSLFPYAKAGATCSNNLTFAPFSSVAEGQVPLYLQQVNNGSVKVAPQETVYTLWVGTNDVGANTILTGQQAPGVTVVDTTECAVNWISTLYKSGARNFIFQNMIPLERTILYAPNSYPNGYWDLERNTTEWSLTMKELTTSGNALAKLMIQDVVPTLKGAHVGLFDSHALFTDMIANPGNYLNGTAPLNVTGAAATCVRELNTGAVITCNSAQGSDRDSYLWWDEVHPSEQADRVVAREIVASINRKSKWITWFS